MAYQTKFAFYEFRVLPFGLNGAPATSQSTMDKILSGCLCFTRAYLDDLTIFSGSWEDDEQHLKEVSGRIVATGLQIHPDKYKFEIDEVQYLGHKVGSVIFQSTNMTSVNKQLHDGIILNPYNNVSRHTNMTSVNRQTTYIYILYI